MIGAIATAVVVLAAFATSLRYDGWQVYRLRPGDETQLERLHRLQTLGVSKRRDISNPLRISTTI